ncbi:ABC transporter substrate-binding protein [Bacillus sp. sid0103]|uniref:ABC transporter substrate-binding protein n=1 Tax=Bacillus sp. sid0103 TaxID=2856337 RepID=UPI001C47C026|nr:ABC transporter substrate-binding protein [Bacillus sp. sid0103]MBV7505306.1 ABC transporter substrate-binding protein [Bacillus sp. sid0103]
MIQKFKKLSWLISSLFILSIALIGCSSETSKETNESNNNTVTKKGGDIHIAIDAQPPTLDPQISTTTATKEIARHVFETLLVLNPKYEVEPMLAESYEKSEDGLTYTFHLRKGVKFHNGKEMTAEDVVASMNRWLVKSTRAANAIGKGQFVEKDPYTVELKIEKPTIGVLDVIASTNQFAAIMPKEIIDNAPKDGITEIVGTGPFKLVEWKPDQYIKLTKYDDYKPVDAPSNGLAGKKEVFVDNLVFDVVTDSSTRLAGITTGQYQIAYQISYDNYDQINSSPDIKPSLNLYGGVAFVFNKKQGPFTNQKLRQAVNTGINNEDVLMGALGNKKFYRLDNGLMYKEQAKWYTDAGKEFYNQHDKEKAKELLKEAGYNGEEVHILATRDYEYIYNTAVVMKQQLEAIGIKVKIDVVDWATLTTKRNDPSAWDAFITGFSPVSIPTQTLPLDPNYAGWPVDAKLQQLTEEIRTASSDKEAMAKWDELQAYNWKEYMAYINIGDFLTFSAYRDKEIKGNGYFEGIILWNTSLTK